MPNWACGPVTVTGTRDGLISFIRRFPDGNADEQRTGYFARSFLFDDRQTLIEDIMMRTEADPGNAVAEITFSVSFAWSAYYCVISGYPEKWPDKCVTLSQACREDRVGVHIRTEEPGLYFEEDILSDEDGNVTESSQDLKTVRCPVCGSTQGTASFMDPADLECFECGSVGLEWTKEV